jgi:UDP-N-acetylmuramoyl-L-alanyl-D-glutamate--2,6-diaminopimelate ligase
VSERTINIRSVALGDLLSGLCSSGEHAGLEVKGLALDGRQINPGDVFVALAGSKGHGLDHLDSAIRAGAIAVIHDGCMALPAACGVPVFEIDGLNERLPELARRMWGDPAGMDLIAVTGTNGKSSVAWLLAQALDGAMIGTLGFGRPGDHQPLTHTTPDVLSLYSLLARLRDQGMTTVVLEASSHALDQGRLAGLSFTSVIFTTLGHDHLDYHQDMATYGAAKSRLFSEFESQRQLINLDDEFGKVLAERLASSSGLIGYGIDVCVPGAIQGRLLEGSSAGLCAEIVLKDNVLTVRAGLLGRVNLYNLMVVAGEMIARGIEPAEIIERIAKLKPVPGRMQPVSGPKELLVIIDYAHTPDALENALASLRQITQGQLWCVFGCGGERDQAKRPRMGRVAEALADRVILTDDNPRHESSLAIIRAIQSGMRHPQRCQVVPDRAQAIRRALSEASATDMVLIAGKGHETDQVIGDERHPFSDEAVVRRFVEEAA